MPHIEIKCFPGRTEEQKKLCTERITEVVAENLGCKQTSVSVAIKEVKEEDWKKEVWDKCIVGEKEYLVKEPGYRCE